MPSKQSPQPQTRECIQLDFEARTVTWDRDDGKCYRIKIRGGYRTSKNMPLCVAVAEAQRYHVGNVNPTSWPGVDDRFLDAFSKRLFGGRPHTKSMRAYWQAFSKAGTTNTPRCQVQRPSRLTKGPAPEGLFSHVERDGFMFFGPRSRIGDRYTHSTVAIKGAPDEIVRFVHDYYARLSPASVVPRERSPFFGRTRECRTVRDLLASPDTPLITITGGPGIGKTRLSQEILRTAGPDFENTLFIGFATAHDDESMAHEVIRTLGASPQREIDPVAQAGALLRQHGRALAVLDNLEHLTNHVPATLSQWIELAERVRFIATSRSPLRLRGEHIIRLRGLNQYNAESDRPDIELFLDRWRRGGRRTHLSATERRAITRICNRAGGNPLVIELLADQEHLQSATVLSRQIARLRSRQSDRSARHVSVRAAVGWSTDRLPQQAQELLRGIAQLGLPGWFDADEMKKVWGLGMSAADDLVESGLIELEERDGARMFHISPAVRSVYGTRKPPTPTVLTRAGVHHATKLTELPTTKIGPALRRFRGMWPNTRVILKGLRNQGMTDLACKITISASWWLSRAGAYRERIAQLKATQTMITKTSLSAADRGVYSDVRIEYELACALLEAGRLSDGVAVVESLAGSPEGCLSADAFADLHLRIARAQLDVGHLDAACEASERAKAAVNRFTDQLQADFRIIRGRVMSERDRYDDAKRELGHAIQAACRAKDERRLALAKNAMGLALHGALEYARAEDRFEEAGTTFRRLRDKRWLAAILNNLAMVQASQGRYGEAAAQLRQAKTLNRKVGNDAWLAANHHNTGIYALYTGDHKLAMREASEAEQLNRALGNAHWLIRNLNLIGQCHLAMEHPDEALAALDEARDLLRKHRQPETAMRNMCYRGIATVRRGAVKTGIRLLERALRTCEHLDDLGPRDRFFCHVFLAEARRDDGDLNEAVGQAQRALKIASMEHLERLASNRKLQDSLNFMRSLASLRGRTKV